MDLFVSNVYNFHKRHPDDTPFNSAAVGNLVIKLDGPQRKLSSTRHVLYLF